MLRTFMMIKLSPDSQILSKASKDVKVNVSKPCCEISNFINFFSTKKISRRAQHEGRKTSRSFLLQLAFAQVLKAINKVFNDCLCLFLQCHAWADRTFQNLLNCYLQHLLMLTTGLKGMNALGVGFLWQHWHFSINWKLAFCLVRLA